MGADVHDFGRSAISRLNLSPEVETAFKDVQAELSNAYRDAFIEITAALREQASALNRIQTTLAMLVTAVKPELQGQVPPAIRVAGAGEAADLASAVVVADPIGAGYSLGQSQIAQALGITQADVSILARAFQLKDDPECAVVVRKGKRSEMVNYHPRAILKFRELIADPPSGLSRNENRTIDRARRRMIIGTP